MFVFWYISVPVIKLCFDKEKWISSCRTVHVLVHGCFTGVDLFPQNPFWLKRIFIAVAFIIFPTPSHLIYFMGFSLTLLRFQLLSTGSLGWIMSNILPGPLLLHLGVKNASQGFLLLRRGFVCHLKYKLVIVKMTTSTQKNFQQTKKTVRKNEVRSGWIKN